MLVVLIAAAGCVLPAVLIASPPPPPTLADATASWRHTTAPPARGSWYALHADRDLNLTNCAKKALGGGFREGKGVFGDAIDPQSNLSAQGGAAGQGRQQQSAPKIKVLDKNGKTKIEYQAKPGEFGVQFK
eukprot:COSAG06_NODE_9792_length_1815_cov_1.787879_2_plen_131_part_00